MGSNLTRIDIGALSVGHYVHLELPWLAHPFSFNQFKVTSGSQLATLRGLGLKNILVDLDKSEVRSPAAEALQAEADDPDVLDTAGAIDRLDGDGDIYRSLLEMAEEQIDEDLSTMDDAMLMENLDALAKAAHRLKGSMGAIGANRAQRACQALEAGGKNKETADIPHLRKDLQHEIDRLRPRVAAYMNRNGSEGRAP